MESQADLWLAERQMLRAELQSLKNCQVTFLTTAVAATGAMLALMPKLSDAKLPEGCVTVACLSPLAILVPFSIIFFDKATTISRIVGYCRVVEKALSSPDPPVHFVGWETVLVPFRHLQAEWKATEEGFWHRLSKAGEIFALRTKHRFWVWTFYTFAALSALYPAASAERRWVDGVLARKKGLGL